MAPEDRSVQNAILFQLYISLPPVSSTPIQGKNFKPKWGKKNRQDNWNRFGRQYQQDEASDELDSPHSDR
jgi:hypothetical protein